MLIIFELFLDFSKYFNHVLKDVIGLQQMFFYQNIRSLTNKCKLGKSIVCH